MLDTQSGKINTVLAAAVEPLAAPPKEAAAAVIRLGVEKQQQLGGEEEEELTATGEPKKPSYLNLACCVNGYSNLTTYDSKFRQNINKSREVSPIRPITTTSQPTVTSTVGGHLSVPYYNCPSNPRPTTNQPLCKSSGNGFVMDQQQQQRSVMSPEKRLFTAHIMQSATTTTSSITKNSSTNGGDQIDNVGMNGGGGGSDGVFRNTRYMTQQRLVVTNKSGENGTTISSQEMKSVSSIGNGTSPCKSFIEQRVERLYGPGALAQGFHANRRSMEKTVLAERNIYSNSLTKAKVSPMKLGGNAFYAPKNNNSTEQQTANGGAENGNELLEEKIPVLRHLRPEFRAQLPISSPKRSPPKEVVVATNGHGAVKNGQAAATTTTTTEDDVLVVQPISLQFQTVSISKLQGVVNGGGSTTTTSQKSATTTMRNAETIESSGEASVGSVGHNDTNIGGNRTSNGGDNNNKCSAAGEVNNKPQKCIELESVEVEAAEVLVGEAKNNMPTKQEIVVEDKENAIVKGGGGGGGVVVMGKSVEKDGNHFLAVMNGERNRILARADHCDTYIDEVTVSEATRKGNGQERLWSVN